MTNKKKALLMISFGSSYADARKSIKNIESHIKMRCPEHDCFRAFTSRKIIKKLAERDGILIDTPLKALEKIYSMGYTDVVCQSLHVINGIEYEMTRDEIMQMRGKFQKITLGLPLLSCKKDYEVIAKMYRPVAARHEAILLMGHGTEHHSNAAYCMLEDFMRYQGINNIFVATVEGFPPLNHAINKMRHCGVNNVTLMPFMIVAGDHAKNDMAGNEDDSWMTILEAQGFNPKVELIGLGDYKEAAEIFYHHAKAADNAGKE